MDFVAKPLLPYKRMSFKDNHQHSQRWVRIGSKLTIIIHSKHPHLLIIITTVLEMKEFNLTVFSKTCKLSVRTLDLKNDRYFESTSIAAEDDKPCCGLCGEQVVYR